MAVRVAINGFGRIGRLAFRQMFGAETVSANAYLPCDESYFNRCANILGLVKSLIATTS